MSKAKEVLEAAKKRIVEQAKREKEAEAEKWTPAPEDLVSRHEGNIHDTTPEEALYENKGPIPKLCHERLAKMAPLFDKFAPRFCGAAIRKYDGEQKKQKIRINTSTGFGVQGDMEKGDNLVGFEVAMHWLEENEGETRQNNGYADKYFGLGYTVSEACPFAFVDLDHAQVDGKLNPTAQRIHEALKNAGYFEYSQSGTGLHYLVPISEQWKMEQAKLGNILQVEVEGQAIEVYFKKHFVALTGRDATTRPWDEWPEAAGEAEQALEALVVNPARKAVAEKEKKKEAERAAKQTKSGNEPKVKPDWLPGAEVRKRRAEGYFKTIDGLDAGGRNNALFVLACRVRREFWVEHDDALEILVDWYKKCKDKNGKQVEVPPRGEIEKTLNSAEANGEEEWGKIYIEEMKENGVDLESPAPEPPAQYPGPPEVMKEMALEAASGILAEDEIDCSDSSSFVLDEDEDENLGDKWGFGDPEHKEAEKKMLAAAMERIGTQDSLLAEYVRFCHSKSRGTIPDTIPVGQGLFIILTAMIQDKFKGKENEANGAEGFDRLKFCLNTGLQTATQVNVVVIAPSGTGKDVLFSHVGKRLLESIGKLPIADATSKEGAIREFTAAKNSDRYFRINEMSNILDPSSYTYGVTKMTIDSFDSGTLQKVNAKTGDSAKCPFAFPCLLGSIQPDVLAMAATRRDSAIGLFRRLLYVYAEAPDLPPKFDGRVKIDGPEGKNLVNKLKALSEWNQEVPVVCSYYENAKDEAALKYKKDPKLKEVAGTLYGTYMPKVAWCLYPCTDLSDERDPKVTKAWQNAKIICDYFMETAKRVIGLIGGYDEKVQIEKEKRDLVLKVCEREFKRNHDRAPVSRVFRGKVESRVKDMRDFREILKTLASMGKLFWEEGSAVIYKKKPKETETKPK